MNIEKVCVFFSLLLIDLHFMLQLYRFLCNNTILEEDILSRVNLLLEKNPQKSKKRKIESITDVKFNVCIVGAGLSGAVIAERYASQLNQTVLILEKRSHIGGNCYDYIDKDTGIRVNLYGAHVFHTKCRRVWDYVQKFSEWIPYEHKVVAFVDGKYVPIPVNIDTVNEIFGLNIKKADEMNQWLQKEQISFVSDPKNSEEISLSRFGPRLYEKFFKPYTIKQWEKHPSELDSEVMARIPVRNNHDDRYFDDPWQALPTNGYTAMFESILSHPLITIRTNINFFSIKNELKLQCGCIYFTGPIDIYFAHLGLPKLEYRSLVFDRRVIENVNNTYFQPTSVVNHPSLDVNYTRIVEYKHFWNKSNNSSSLSNHTIVFYERSIDGGEPYYPVPTKSNKLLYVKYQNLAKKESNVTFVGRLANYKYFNMDQSILNSLELFDKIQHRKD